MSAEFAIAIHCKDWDGAVADAPGLCRRAAEAAWTTAGMDNEVGGGGAIPRPEIGLVLTDDAEVAGLNVRFRGIEGPTNVLSFPSGETVADGAGAEELAPDRPPVLLGDVVIALETTAREAARDGKPVGDHLQHLVVHGLLHLLGFDHQDEQEAESMESMEVEILSVLGVPNPYTDGVARR